ncbi:MAG: MmcQ/YjbR family DNA-binding protein [Candidatus Acidiferrales bacterium]
MYAEWAREYCLSLAHVTEQIQWQDDLVFKVGGRMFSVVALEPGGHWLSFKCGPDDFAELVERPGLLPAPYLARAHWVALETEDALPRDEIKKLLSLAHALVFAKLPKKTQASLIQPKPRKTKSMKHRR